MVDAGRNPQESPINDKHYHVRAMCRPLVNRLIKRLNNGVSLRALAGKIKISHPTLLALQKKPEETLQHLSKKTMFKIIRFYDAKKNKGSGDHKIKVGQIRCSF